MDMDVVSVMLVYGIPLVACRGCRIRMTLYSKPHERDVNAGVHVKQGTSICVTASLR